MELDWIEIWWNFIGVHGMECRLNCELMWVHWIQLRFYGIFMVMMDLFRFDGIEWKFGDRSIGRTSWDLPVKWDFMFMQSVSTLYFYGNKVGVLL